MTDLSVYLYFNYHSLDYYDASLTSKNLHSNEQEELNEPLNAKQIIKNADEDEAIDKENIGGTLKHLFNFIRSK